MRRYRVEETTTFAMAKVMITCPETGNDVYTGITIDEESDEEPPGGNQSIWCPHCTQVHVWHAEDTHLDGEAA